jgi:hypothetical protein
MVSRSFISLNIVCAHSLRDELVTVDTEQNTGPWTRKSGDRVALGGTHDGLEAANSISTFAITLRPSTRISRDVHAPIPIMVLPVAAPAFVRGADYRMRKLDFWRTTAVLSQYPDTLVR